MKGIGWLALDSDSAVGTMPTRWLGQSHVGRPQSGASLGGPLEVVEWGWRRKECAGRGGHALRVSWRCLGVYRDPLLPSGLRLWYWVVRQKRPRSAWFAGGLRVATLAAVGCSSRRWRSSNALEVPKRRANDLHAAWTLATACSPEEPQPQGVGCGERGGLVRHLGVGGQQTDQRVKHVAYERVPHQVHGAPLDGVQELARAERRQRAPLGLYYPARLVSASCPRTSTVHHRERARQAGHVPPLIFAQQPSMRAAVDRYGPCVCAGCIPATSS
jgi:hypothetical protein